MPSGVVGWDVAWNGRESVMMVDRGVYKKPWPKGVDVSGLTKGLTLDDVGKLELTETAKSKGVEELKDWRATIEWKDND